MIVYYISASLWGHLGCEISSVVKSKKEKTRRMSQQLSDLVIIMTLTQVTDLPSEFSKCLLLG